MVSILPSVTALKRRTKKAFSSKEGFKQFIQTKEQGAYFNEDLLPSPPCKQSSR